MSTDPTLKSTMSYESLLNLLEDPHRTAPEALDSNALLAPDRMAVRYGDSGVDMTYGEFKTLTDDIAGNLHQLGAVQGDRILVLSTSTRVSLEVMYGAWKAGLVYAPVNYQLAGQLLAHQIRVADGQFIVVDADLHDAFIEATAGLDRAPQAVLVGNGSARPGAHVYSDLLRPASRPDIAITPEMPANIVYTSGTTGPSKAVSQSHRWVNAYTWLGRQVINSEDVLYSDLPMYHIAAAHWNAARALWVGATLSVWDGFSTSQFWERIAKHQCTSAVLLNAMTPRLMAVPPTDTDHHNTLNKVHFQPLPPTHSDMAQRFGFDIVTSGFGQSESGSCLTSILRECPPGTGTPAALYRGMSVDELCSNMEALGFPVFHHGEETPPGLMGRPSPFIELSVRDDNDNECPDDVPGEMCVRPLIPGVIMDGYWGQPVATLQAFRHLWFHTGDAVIRRGDGLFTYVDRLGDRIRVSGENFSSLDLEQVLAAGPNVGLVAAVKKPDPVSGEDTVVAFLEWQEPALGDVDRLREYAHANLPKYMRPSEYFVVDEIPRTLTNKVEKYKLRDMIPDC